LLIILLRPQRVWTYSRLCDLLTNTLPHPRRVHSLSSIVQIIINKLQSLERTKDFIVKLSIQITRTLNSSIQKNIILLRTSLRAYIDFSHAQLKSNDSDGTGNEAATILL